LNGREEEPDERADDRDHDEEFDERERPPGGTVWHGWYLKVP
jgi:hypothetical protein